MVEFIILVAFDYIEKVKLDKKSEYSLYCSASDKSHNPTSQLQFPLHFLNLDSKVDN